MSSPECKRVLLSAFSCGPGKGSEPGIGWNWLVQASKRHEVWLITSDEHTGEIEQSCPPTVHPVFIPSYKTWSRLKRLPLPTLDWIYYYWWQWKAYCVARELQARIHFDIVHHITFGSWRTPSFLSLLPVPFVWGPVGGGETVPLHLRAELGLKGRVTERMRDLSQLLSRFDPAIQLTMRRASIIVAANRDTLALIPPRFKSKTRTMPAIGISTSADRITSHSPCPEHFLVLLVALLEPRKGAALAIRGFAEFYRSHKHSKLVVIGKGPQREPLDHLAKELGISEAVRFTGGLPREDVLRWMSVADVFLLPSLRDSGGFVYLEAMNCGTPVVCLDLGGPGEIVTAGTGIKIPPGEAPRIISCISAALTHLVETPGLRNMLGEEARRRIQETYDWDQRGKQVYELYMDALQVTQQTLSP